MKEKVLIRIENISKSFEDHVALDNISLSIRENECLTLLGPSGCGKTTMLRILGVLKSQMMGGFCMGIKISWILLHIKET